MKKVVVLALLLLVCVSSLLAQSNDKKKKKSMTDSIFQINMVEVMGKKNHADVMGLNVPLRFIPIDLIKLPSEVLERKGITAVSYTHLSLP